MRRETTFITICVCATVIACASIISNAGPITPPSGPIEGTYKTLDEVEPRTPLTQQTTPGEADSVFTITEPGSYYLTGPIAAESGKHGIKIRTSDVTIDLGGFVHDGGADAGIVSRTGIINFAGFAFNFVITNGTLKGWGESGIVLGDVSSNVRIERIIAQRNGEDGINVGQQATLIECQALTNGGAGITAASDAVVDRCIAHENGEDGIDLVSRSIVTNSVSSKNGGDGFNASSMSRFVDCVAEDNGESGFNIASGHISGCIAFGNDEHGFFFRKGLIENCTAESNSLHGIITAESGSSIIFVAPNVIRNNHCINNDTGILVDSRHVTVEGNTLTENDSGIRIARPNLGALVVRNNASENTVANFFVSQPGNTAGPFVDITTQGGLVGVSNADHPQANFFRR